MSANFKPLFAIDGRALAESLTSRTADFDRITLRQEMPGSPHHDTKSIYLRGPGDPTAETWRADCEQIDYDGIWPEAKALLMQIADKLGGVELGKVMITALPPARGIDWHIDQGPYAEAFDRGHVALITNAEARLYSGQEQANLPPCRFVQFNNRILHSAANHGATVRVHLIVDWRRGTGITEHAVG